MRKYLLASAALIALIGPANGTIISSGALTMTAIQNEFGGSNPISMSEYYAGGARVPGGTSGVNGAVPSSGAIAMSKFYGTTAFTPFQQVVTSSGSVTKPDGATGCYIRVIGPGGNGGGAYVDGSGDLYGSGGGGGGGGNAYGQYTATNLSITISTTNSCTGSGISMSCAAGGGGTSGGPGSGGSYGTGSTGSGGNLSNNAGGDGAAGGGGSSSGIPGGSGGSSYGSYGDGSKGADAPGSGTVTPGAGAVIIDWY